MPFNECLNRSPILLFVVNLYKYMIIIDIIIYINDVYIDLSDCAIE